MDRKQISTILQENIDMLGKLFADCDDFVIHKLRLGEEQVQACLFFLRGMSNDNIINRVIRALSTLQEFSRDIFDQEEWLMNNLGFHEVYRNLSLDTVADIILSGDLALLVEGQTECVLVGSTGLEYRTISEPVTEGVVKGPREGFNESIKTNLTLIRRRMRTFRLKSEHFKLGRVSNTEVRIAYLKDAAQEALVEEVRKRLRRIDTESILESQYIEEFIEDKSFTLFPQVESTERPDKVAAAILAGRVAILVDGTPFVMIVPVTLTQLLVSSEDYYQRFPFSLFIRLIRYAAACFSLLLPAIYIAVTTFHQEMIPTPLMISIVESYEKVPFPVFVEAMLLELTFEVLREAGIRLPRPIGQAVSIVGALVIGQAAVQAGLVSYGMVIVVSLTGIMSFVTPSYNIAISFRLLRFVFMITGATLGLFGVMLGIVFLLLHLASLRSFGVPYLSPVAPVRPHQWKDTLMRYPWWSLAGRSGKRVGNNNR